jgi:hypothetical protein
MRVYGFLYIAPSHLKILAHTKLLFPKSTPIAKELNNSIGKSVKACLHHKQERTDRVLPQVSRANLVVGQQEFVAFRVIFIIN